MSKVKLQSSDDKEFEVDKSIAVMSVTIKNMLDGNFFALFPCFIVA
jgi:hypothetical protein